MPVDHTEGSTIMKNITSAQLREMFQSFMESKGH